MVPDFLATIDAGTGSIRVLAYNVKSRILGFHQTECHYHSDIDGPETSLVFDPSNLATSAVLSFKKALAKAEVPKNSVGAIACTSQRDGVVFLDEKLNEIYCGPNVDTRLIASEWPDTAMNMDNYFVSGRWIGPLFLPYRLEWFKRYRSRTYESTRHVFSMSDWLAFRLGGEICTEPTNSAETGLFNIEKRAWDEQLINGYGYSSDIFPRTSESASVLGTVSHSLAEDVGISAKTVIVSGGADAQFALLGCGITSPGNLGVIAGTWGPIQLVTDRPIFDREVRTWTGCFVNPSSWILESSSMMIGLVHRWIRDVFYSSEADPYYAIERDVASSEAGRIGIFSLLGTGIMNARNLDLAPVGAIHIPSHFFITRDSNRGNIAKAAYESTCFSVACNIEQITAVYGKQPQSIHVCGGVGRSKEWLKMLATILGREILVPDTIEATGIGGLIAAGVGSDFWDWDTGRRLLVRSKTIPPVHGEAETYRALCTEWKERLLSFRSSRSRINSQEV